MVNVFATAFFENRPIHRDPPVANVIATALSESRPKHRDPTVANVIATAYPESRKIHRVTAPTMRAATCTADTHTQTDRVVLVIALGAVVSIAVQIHNG